MPTVIRPAASTVVISLLTAALVGFLGGGLAGSLSSNVPALPGSSTGASGSASPSPGASPSSAAGLTLRSDVSSVKRGSQITLSGTIAPARAGIKVQVQRRIDDGDWSNFPVQATTKARGAFSTTVQSSRVGRNDFRVVARVGGDTITSAAVSVTIT